jgi:hypothetical protein
MKSKDTNKNRDGLTDDPSNPLWKIYKWKITNNEIMMITQDLVADFKLIAKWK